MTQIMPLEAVPASPADADEAPWCQAHWGDLAVRSGEDALEGQVLDDFSPSGAAGAAASPALGGVESAR